MIYRYYHSWKEREFQRWVEALRAADGVIMAVPGVFDLLHGGHISLLAQARAHARHAVVVVLVNADESANRLKGGLRPYQPLDERLYQLQALRDVDMAVGFEEDTPEDVLRLLRAEIMVKGAEYQDRPLPGEQLVKRVYLANMDATFTHTSDLAMRVYEKVCAGVC